MALKKINSGLFVLLILPCFWYCINKSKNVYAYCLAFFLLLALNPKVAHAFVILSFWLSGCKDKSFFLSIPNFFLPF